MPNENSYEVALQKSNAIREGLAKTPEKFTMLTGDRPTGRLHLGHYFGTLKGRVELQNMGAKTNVLIADYQVITDRDTTEHIQDNVYNMVMDYLACGIDPDKTMIYAHSAVPAANQLMLPFLSLVSEAELARNPTVKAEMEASATSSPAFCSPTRCTRPATSCSARAMWCPSVATSCRTSSSPAPSPAALTTATARCSPRSTRCCPRPRCCPAWTGAR